MDQFQPKSLNLVSLFFRRYRRDFHLCRTAFNIFTTDRRSVLKSRDDLPLRCVDSQDHLFRQGNVVDGDDACTHSALSPLGLPLLGFSESVLLMVIDYVASSKSLLDAMKLAPMHRHGVKHDFICALFSSKHDTGLWCERNSGEYLVVRALHEPSQTKRSLTCRSSGFS